MSSLIQKSAYFLMETNVMGRIIFSNDDTSFELLSKEEAKYALRVAVNRKLIDKAERDILEQQIESSSLPAKLSEMMEQLLTIKSTVEETYRICNEEFGGLPSDTFSSKDGAEPESTFHIHGDKHLH